MRHDHLVPMPSWRGPHEWSKAYYNRVNWADSPATTSAINASDLNVMDAGIAACLQADGSVTASAASPVSVTLGGSTRTVCQWTATDGKTYKLVLGVAANTLRIVDSTDNITVAEFYPDGVSRSLVYDNGLGTIRQVRRFLGTTDPSTYLTPNEGDEWDNG